MKNLKTKTYTISDREAGNVIDRKLTLSEAEKKLKEYEEADKKDKTYTPDFYEIVDFINK